MLASVLVLIATRVVRFPGRVQCLAAPLAVACLAAPAAWSAPASVAGATQREVRPATGSPAAADSTVAPEAIRRLLDDGWYAFAEPRARELLRREEVEHGPESPPARTALDLLVLSLWRQGKVTPPETRALAERAVALHRRAEGEMAPGTALALNSLANILSQQGAFAESRGDFERALAIRTRYPGVDSLDLAWTLNDLGGLDESTGRRDEARVLFDRVLRLRLQALGPEHPLVAWSHSAIAYLNQREGDYVAAIRGFERVLAIRERVLPPDHPDIAHAINSLADLYGGIGDYARAREYAERALGIRTRSLGPDSPEVAKSLSTLASILRETGDYAQARSMAERALDIRERVFGAAHPEVATALTNLAVLLMKTGSDAEARPLLDRAEAIRTASFGAQSPNVAVVDELQSTLALDTGDFPRARERARAALDALRASMAPDHPSIAGALESIGGTDVAVGDLAAARDAYRSALTMLEKAQGDSSAQMGRCARLLAEVYERLGDGAGAARLYDHALAVEEHALGPAHPEVAACLRGVARARMAANDATRAMDAALRAEAIGREHLRYTIQTLPEDQALRYGSVRVAGLDLALTIAARAGRPELSRRAYDALVRSRALVLDEMAWRQRTVLARSDSSLAAAERRLLAARRQCVRLTLVGAESGLRASYPRTLDSLRAVCERLEREMTAESSVYRTEQARTTTGLAEVAAVLPRGAALVSYARYAVRDGAAAGQPQYIAFVQRWNASVPEAILLGPAAAIDSAVAMLRGNAAARDVPDDARLEAAYRSIGTRLRRAIWDPVASGLGGCDTVFLVPDGALNLINFAALPVAGDRYLVESGPLLHVLSTERDLVDDATRAYAGHGLLALGAADYDAAGDRARAPRARFGERRAPSPAYRGLAADCDSVPPYFEPLPSTRREVEEIAALWHRAHAGRGQETADDCVCLTDAGASESEFLRHAPHRLLIHMATHAFTVAPHCGRPAGRAGAAESDAGGIPFNPLAVSGLALAGANRRGDGVDPARSLLTAEEIATLDLTGTRWVVLSACNSGVGSVLDDEGVLGLRRAIQTAGAGTVIMSLWPVEDVATRRWMRALYRARFERGWGTAASLREASREFLGEQRRHGETTHPRLWGAFVAAGDWR